MGRTGNGGRMTTRLDRDGIFTLPADYAPRDDLNAPPPTTPAFIVSGLACGWFATCDHSADAVMDHPVLGPVPICQRCADTIGMEL